MDIISAKRMARRLMNKHGLQAWTLKFTHAKRRFGSCTKRSRLITISQPLTELNSIEQVRDTILHEIAHALAPHGASHGIEWKRICVRIGAEPKRCYGDDVVQPKMKPRKVCVGHCPECGYETIRRQRHVCSCPQCDVNWNPKYQIVWDEPVECDEFFEMKRNAKKTA